jgi:DNA end-binding protein Ku
MPRAIWTGAITVGLLNIPVKLVAAVRVKSISFNQIDEKTHSRIRYQKVAEATDELVDSEHIVKGFDMGGGHYVIIDDDDLKAVAPAKSKEIGIDSFVPVDQIPDVMYDAGYIIQPGKIAKPYALLAKALAETGKLALGKFVMRQKEYLAVIRSDGEHLTLSTLVFPDEVVDPATVEGLEDLDGVSLTDRELSMANSLVEALSDPFEPDNFRDTYRASVMELIEAKAAGKTLAIEAAPQRAEVIDIAAALEASVEAAKASRGRHPTARKAPAKKAERARRSA